MNYMIVGYLKKDEDYKARQIFYEIKKDNKLEVTLDTFTAFIMHYIPIKIAFSVIVFSNIFILHLFNLIYFDILIVMKKLLPKQKLSPFHIKHLTTALKNNGKEDLYQKFVVYLQYMLDVIFILT